MRLHSVEDELQVERAQRQSMGAEVERLTWEIADLTESFHTTRTEVDALRAEGEEVERMLEEARIGTDITGL